MAKEDVSKIYWLVDEWNAKLGGREFEVEPINRMLDLTMRLPYEVVDVEACFTRVKNALEINHTLANSIDHVIDLTQGWMTKRLSPFFPNARFITDLDIHRVRSVLDLKVAGYLVNENFVNSKYKGEELGNVAILDNTSFSGKTGFTVARLLSLDISKVLFVNLLSNRGYLPGGQLGSLESYESLGAKNISGFYINSDTEDAWHFIDLFNQENIQGLVDSFPQIIEDYSSILAQEKSLAEINSKHLNVLFPKAMNFEELESLRQKNQFLPAEYYEANKDNFYSINPLLWGISDIYQHFDISKIQKNLPQLVYLMSDMFSKVNAKESVPSDSK